MAYRQPANEHNARDLYWSADSWSEMYPAKQRIKNTLKRHAIKGDYDHTKAAKLWRYWMDEAAKLYVSMGLGKTMQDFPPATRQLAAEMIEADEWVEYECNGWE